MSVLKEITTQQKIKIASHLFGLANKRINPTEHEGVCGNLAKFFKGGPSKFKIISYLSIGWPKHSLDDFYPVPHVYGAKNAFMIYRLWGDDDYGNDRRELCDFIACKLIESL
jgi:hypothetical protein